MLVRHPHECVLQLVLCHQAQQWFFVTLCCGAVASSGVQHQVCDATPCFLPLLPCSQYARKVRAWCVVGDGDLHSRLDTFSHSCMESKQCLLALLPA